MAGKRNTRRPREDEVDRSGLAGVIRARMEEKRISQTELADKTGIGISTIRKMQNGQGTQIFGNSILSSVSRGLEFPEDKLRRTFYRLPEQDPITPSGVELVRAAIRAELAPHLAKIDAIHDTIHHVNQRIDAVIGMGTHSPGDD